MYALIDCNNFFVSCERLFRPELEGRPVVVLSSNDGCAVSRSQEAKALGIPMGAPHFRFRELFRRHGVIPFSANFELYGDISERITNLLASITPKIEVYSVDESFLDLTDLGIKDHEAWGVEVRAVILKNVGIPVSVGIAPSKTLAKAANNYAKKHPETGGVVRLNPVQPGSEACDLALASMPIEDVWGVGWKLAPKLRAEGVHTALDLRQMNYKRAQQLMGIHGRHMVYELNGVNCLPFQKESKPQQMIMRGRQFGEDTHEFYVIESAIATLAARAAATLRQEKQLARRAAVLLRTNRHKPGYQQVSEGVRFYTPTSDTGTITSQLVQMLATSYNPGQAYHKAEVLLYDFVPEAGLQTDLLGTVDVEMDAKSHRKMQAVDSINLRHGKGTLKYAAEALSQAWQPRKNLVSPRYTSAWSDLPEVRLL
jgi:DNA polymerase V